MGGDESAHAFAVPDNFSFRMAFPYELSEGVQILIPLGRMADIAAAFVDGIAALATDFVGVNGGVGLAIHEIISEIGVIDGGSAKSVDSDDDDVLFEMVSFPSAVTKYFSALFCGNGIVCRRTAVEGGEQDT